MNDAEFLKELIRRKNSIDRKEKFEQFFKFIFNNIRDGISILDVNLNIIGVNSLLENWFSHKIPFIGEKCYKIYHNRQEPCVGCPTLKAVQQKRTIRGIMPYDEPEKEKNWHEIYSFPLYNENNEVEAIIEYIKDPTETSSYKKAVNDLKQKLNDDLRQSMRDRSELKTSTLRMLLSAIKYAEIKPDKQVTLTDTEILGVIAKEIKQREDSIEAFKKGNRQDLADKEIAELNILKTYMPPQLTRDEIIAEANQAISEVGARGPGDKGKVMGKLVAKLKGRADGKIINEVVTDLLSRM